MGSRRKVQTTQTTQATETTEPRGAAHAGGAARELYCTDCGATGHTARRCPNAGPVPTLDDYEQLERAGRLRHYRE